LIAWLKANPDKVSAGIPLASSHLLTVFFQKETGTRFALVPYRGSPAAFQDLMAGRIDLVFYTLDQLPLGACLNNQNRTLIVEGNSWWTPNEHLIGSSS
jgi:tripartite-type tricarboxylate transporter receptor subunit TctC